MLVERSFDFRNIIYFSYEISLKYAHKQIERTFFFETITFDWCK